MTLVGPRYHVLDGGPERQFLGNVAAHCKVMKHSIVSCVKTTEQIDMPFWMKTWVGPRNHVLDGSAGRQTGKGNLGVVRAIRQHQQSSWLQRSR